MDTKDLSIIITTFKSEGKIHSCINSISKNIKILVIENSGNEKFKTDLETKYHNVKCILTGYNSGYASGNNLGLTNVKTKYALVLNPDTLIEKDSIENFISTAKKNPDFWLIGPINHQGKKIEIQSNQLIEVEDIKGFAIFFNLKKFKNNFFDNNYFLYFEEIDLCRRVKQNNGKIYLDPRIKIHHDGSQSVNQDFKIELEKNRNWHWMWSTFYFHKKHKGFALALMIIFPKMASAFFKVLFYLMILKKTKKDIYLCRLSGIINSIKGKKSWYRPTLD